MNDLVKQNKAEMEIIDNEVRIKAQNFQKKLHANVDESKILKNKFANDSLYVPISVLEMQLDEFFFGLWSIENFTYLPVANEIVGSLDLKVFHPVHKTWITRTGAGAVQIQMKSKAKGGSGDITEIRDKIVNTLTKDFPHLKAECLRNACKSLGKVFGRDLNRDFEDQYTPIIRQPQEDDILNVQLKIMEHFDTYQGTDKKALQTMCSEKQKANEFDLKFAKEIAAKVGLKL